MSDFTNRPFRPEEFSCSICGTSFWNGQNMFKNIYRDVRERFSNIYRFLQRRKSENFADADGDEIETLNLVDRDSDNDSSLPSPLALDQPSYSFEVYEEYSPFTLCRNLLRVETLHLAKQIAIIDSYLFTQIKWEEISKGGWMSSKKDKYSPNVVAMTWFFNKLLSVISCCILSQEKHSDRAKTMTWSIKLASKLNQLGDFNGATAIVTSLLSFPIYRLEHSWKIVPSSTIRTFEKLKSLHSVGESEKMYMKLLTDRLASASPFVPYSGKYLSRLSMALNTTRYQQNLSLSSFDDCDSFGLTIEMNEKASTQSLSSLSPILNGDLLFQKKTSPPRSIRIKINTDFPKNEKFNIPDKDAILNWRPDDPQLSIFESYEKLHSLSKNNSAIVEAISPIEDHSDFGISNRSPSSSSSPNHGKHKEMRSHRRIKSEIPVCSNNYDNSVLILSESSDKDRTSFKRNSLVSAVKQIMITPMSKINSSLTPSSKNSLDVSKSSSSPSPTKMPNKLLSSGIRYSFRTYSPIMEKFHSNKYCIPNNLSPQNKELLFNTPKDCRDALELFQNFSNPFLEIKPCFNTIMFLYAMSTPTSSEIRLKSFELEPIVSK